MLWEVIHQVNHHRQMVANGCKMPKSKKRKLSKSQVANRLLTKKKALVKHAREVHSSTDKKVVVSVGPDMSVKTYRNPFQPVTPVVTEALTSKENVDKPEKTDE